MNNHHKLPFRLGATSYIWPDDILPNVLQLATLVDDVELVLFESDEYGSNLPDETVVAELGRLAQAHGLTYTVHLPLDLRLAADDAARHPSLEQAQRVIERTRTLAPFAYIVHLDGAMIQDSTDTKTLAHWQSLAMRSLEQVTAWTGDARKVCVENLESYDAAAFAPVLDTLAVSRCVDVGHLWRQGHDPLPHLRQCRARTRVVHLHGLEERDHKSLTHVPPEALDPVVAYLLENARGVVTLEVFSVDDFFSSQSALAAAVERYRCRKH